MLSTISAYEISAEQFFETLRTRRIDLLLDVRLKNTNQLCGFTKRNDLAYLTRTICGASYIHDLSLAPDAQLLERYQKHWIGWEGYSRAYWLGLQELNATKHVRTKYGQYQTICLLGTATKRRRSHTEVLEQFLKGEM